MTRTTLVAGLALVTLTLARPARAQADDTVGDAEGGDASAPSPGAPWPAATGDTPPLDPLLEPGPPLRYRPAVDDPRVAVGIGLIGGGAVFLAGGISVVADAKDDFDGAVCGLSGCTTYRDTAAQESPGVAMSAGGAATALFGLVVLAHGLGDGKPLEAASSGRLAAGMALTGFGFGTTIGGSALLMHAAIEGSGLEPAGLAMFVPAVGLLATGLPLWITGSRPPPSRPGAYDWKRPKEAATREVMRSPTMGSIGVGMAVFGLGVVGAGIGAAVEGSRRAREEGSLDVGAPITFLTTTTPAGAALFSLGLPLAIIGLSPTSPAQAHASAPGLSLPAIDVGVGGANVTWRY